jgi:hypothetical protein
MTTDLDTRARIEFNAAAYLLYAKEHTMREYCPHCRRELCPSEGRIFAGICIDCFLADKAPAPRDAEMLAGHRAEDMTNGGIEPDWCPCGAPIPETGDSCPDCAQESVPEEIKAMRVAQEPPLCACGEHYDGEPCPYQAEILESLQIAWRALIALAALALSLTTHTAHAAPYTPTAPIGCAVTGYAAQDDMSAIAVCAGGYLVTKEDGPRDIWNDIPYSVETLYLTDAQGIVHEVPKLD